MILQDFTDLINEIVSAGADVADGSTSAFPFAVMAAVIVLCTISFVMGKSKREVLASVPAVALTAAFGIRSVSVMNGLRQIPSAMTAAIVVLLCLAAYLEYRYACIKAVEYVTMLCSRAVYGTWGNNRKKRLRYCR